MLGPRSLLPRYPQSPNVTNENSLRDRIGGATKDVGGLPAQEYEYDVLGDSPVNKAW